MPEGPTLIFDKSTLQSLKIRETEWLGHHFHFNIIEPLYIEVIGAAGAADRKNPVGDVAALAEKLLGIILTTAPNMRHGDLVFGELLGLQFEMDGRIVLDNVQLFRRRDGGITAFQDEPPEMEALRRISRGTLTEREKIGVEKLRKFKEQIDLSRIKEAFGRPLPGIEIRSLDEALAVIDRFLSELDRFPALQHLMTHFRLPPQMRLDVLKRWKKMNDPPLKDFSPYAYHLLRVDHLFDLGIGHGLIKTSDPNHLIDAMYLYYLPFCEIFVSSDKFHRELVPLFLRPYQRFCWGPDLKAGATALAAYYEGIPDEVRRTGSMNYARLPPKDGDFFIAKIFDDLRPGWRDS